MLNLAAPHGRRGESHPSIARDSGDVRLGNWRCISCAERSVVGVSECKCGASDTFAPEKHRGKVELSVCKHVSWYSMCHELGGNIRADN
jgi:hypothetical protein